MTPEEARAWLPIVRDFILLMTGLALIIFGVVKGRVDPIIAGFGLTGIAVAGRTLGFHNGKT